MKIFSVIFLIIALLLESALTTLPLLLLTLLVFTTFFKDKFIFILAFVFGILLDVMALGTIGLSSLFFVVFVFLIIMYQSKFEITTNNFIFAASFLGSIGFLLIHGYANNIIIEAMVSAILGLILFKSFQKINRIG
jgi:cell shape-determining protein MreD